MAGAAGGGAGRRAALRRSLALCGRALGRTLARVAFHAGDGPRSVVPYRRGSDGGAILRAVNDFLRHRNDLCWRGDFSDSTNIQSAGALANGDSDVGRRRAGGVAAVAALDASSIG